MRSSQSGLRGGLQDVGARVARLAWPCALVAGLAGAREGLAQQERPPEQPPAVTAQETRAEERTPQGADEKGVVEAVSVADLLFEDFGVVVTAGRTAQPANMTGVPISVITAADLHFGGFSTVVDAMSFAPGVDALAVDRNRFAVGVRGLHQEFSDRTLFLIDGRNAGNALFGGADFERLPIFVEDLARIEIGRGPGGAVWGANAFNGVVNFIRKKPTETLGTLASVAVDEFGDAHSQLRWGAQEGALAWRLSFGYEQEVSSEDAIAGDDFDSRDFSRVYRFDSEAEYRLSDAASLRFGAGHVHIARGDFPFLVFQPGQDERIDSTTAHLQYEWGQGQDAGGTLQWYGTFEDVNRPTLWRYNSVDNSLEGSLRFVPAEGHEAMVGAALRLVRIRTRRVRPEDLLGDRTLDEQWLGAYALDRFSPLDWLTLEGQVRVDWYSETTVDWSGRLSAFVSLDQERRHVLRLSAAKAFRAPQSGLQRIATNRVELPSPPTPPGTFAAQLLPSGGLDNEEIWSLETGYTAQLAEDLTLRADAYYQRYQDLTGAALFPDPLQLGRTIAQLQQLGDAEAVGAEVELRYSAERLEAALWWAVNEFDFREDATQNARAFEPAKHKVGASLRTELLSWLTLAANYRYTGVTPASLFTPAVAAHHRLDLVATLQLGGVAELQLGVRDVFDDTDLAVDTVGSGVAPFETPGRTFFVRLQAAF